MATSNGSVLPCRQSSQSSTSSSSTHRLANMSSQVKVYLLIGLIVNWTFFVNLSVSGAAPAPASAGPKRHPPHNGSMFGKRSLVIPIIGASAHTSSNWAPHSPQIGLSTAEDLMETTATYTDNTQMPASNSRILENILMRTIDQCIQDQRLAGN